MKKKAHLENTQSSPELDESTLNSAGGARRKLVQALGGAGGVVGGLLLTGWRKPVVESVILPAHAQTTTETGGPTPTVCNAELGWTAGMVFPVGSGTGVISLLFDGVPVTVSTFTNPFSSAAATASTHVGTADGSTLWGYSMSWLNSDVGSGSNRANPFISGTCCDTSVSEQFFYQSTNGTDSTPIGYIQNGGVCDLDTF